MNRAFFGVYARTTVYRSAAVSVTDSAQAVASLADVSRRHANFRRHQLSYEGSESARQSKGKVITAFLALKVVPLVGV